MLGFADCHLSSIFIERLCLKGIQRNVVDKGSRHHCFLQPSHAHEQLHSHTHGHVAHTHNTHSHTSEPLNHKHLACPLCHSYSVKRDSECGESMLRIGCVDTGEIGQIRQEWADSCTVRKLNISRCSYGVVNE